MSVAGWVLACVGYAVLLGVVAVGLPLLMNRPRRFHGVTDGTSKDEK